MIYGSTEDTTNFGSSCVAYSAAVQVGRNWLGNVELPLAKHAKPIRELKTHTSELNRISV